MRELGGKLWSLVCLVMDVIRRNIELDPRKNSEGFNLRKISRDQLVSKIPGKSFVTLAGGEYIVPMEVMFED